MCGIAGIFHFGAAADHGDAQGTLLRMRDAMRHRGPDDAGIYVSDDRRVLLAHRRLSIVDLSPAGHQPMANEDRSVWIAFNGEIYNHAALRPGLLAHGHTFRSRTDTEAIIHLYEQEGVSCVEHLDGMFAFALWDDRQRRLLLCRDRLGKKPLYYAVVGGRLIFASEARALLQHEALGRDLDLTALDLYLTFGNVPPPYTLLRGVRKLPPAHLLLCDETGRIETRRYWDPVTAQAQAQAKDKNGHNGRPAVRLEESTERVRELLAQAVRKRLMSDVPVGAFLSGGIDSSTNVALMTEFGAGPLRTFSAGFAGFGEAQNFHDLPYARRVAERFGCRHEEVILTEKECQGYLTEMAAQQDEPIADPACLPMHFVSQAARRAGVTVVLVGEGSDEVFGGYEDFAQLIGPATRKWRWLNRLPHLLRHGLYQVSRQMQAPPGRIDVLRRAAHDEPLYWGLDVVFWDTEKESLLLPPAHAGAGPGAATVVRGYYDELRALRPDADPLQQISYVELSNRLPELLLMRVDKLTMAHSLEARAPFLDADLVSYAFSLPQEFKVHGKIGKRVLKDAVRPILPAEVIDRPKQGFRVPLPAWLAGDLSSWAEERLFSSSLRRLGLFNFNYIDDLWRRHRARTQDHSFDLWCLINLASWHQHWIGS
jgi:asparagine synthase (glutamine-hydrolysing)